MCTYLVLRPAPRCSSPRSSRQRRRSAQSPEFRWHGSIAQGNAIEIRGEWRRARRASGSNEVEVVAVKHARRSNPEDVRIEVVTHAEGSRFARSTRAVTARDRTSARPAKKDG